MLQNIPGWSFVGGCRSGTPNTFGRRIIIIIIIIIITIIIIIIKPYGACADTKYSVNVSRCTTTILW